MSSQYTGKRNTEKTKSSKVGTSKKENEEEGLEEQKMEEIEEVFNLFAFDKKEEKKKLMNGKNIKICLKTLGIDAKKKEIIQIIERIFKENKEKSDKQSKPQSESKSDTIKSHEQTISNQVKKIDDDFTFEEFKSIVQEKRKEINKDEEMGKEFLLLCDYKEGESDPKKKDKLRLTRESLSQLAEAVGETMSKEEIEEMIQIVGGGKGEITQEDFVSFMTNPYQIPDKK